MRECIPGRSPGSAVTWSAAKASYCDIWTGAIGADGYGRSSSPTGRRAVATMRSIERRPVQNRCAPTQLVHVDRMPPEEVSVGIDSPPKASFLRGGEHNDPERTLHETMRVLGSDGQLLFIERVRACLRFIAQCQEPVLRRWRRFAAGCQCNHPTAPLNSRAGSPSQPTNVV